MAVSKLPGIDEFMEAANRVLTDLKSHANADKMALAVGMASMANKLNESPFRVRTFVNPTEINSNKGGRELC